MKRKIYLSLLLFLPALIGYGQGSQINSTVETFAGGYYGAYGQLTYGTGYIITPRATPATSSVYFTAGSSYIGASNASHVNGYAEKEGTTAFIFPIGNGTKLMPAAISAPASSAKFQAAYWFANANAAALPAGGPFLVANKAAGVGLVSTVEYWDINGSLPVNLTLTWDAASDLNTLTGSNMANLVIAGYNTASSQWQSLGAAGGTTGTLAATGTITANAVTPDTYSAFTFASAVILGEGSDLRPLYVMSDVGFIKPAALTKNATLRLYNVGTAVSVAAGPITVYIYPPNDQFSVTLGAAPGWSLSYDAVGDYYTLISTSTTVAFGAANFQAVPLVITAAPAVSKGKYAVNFEVADGSGGETNNLNNTVPIEVTVSSL